MISEAIRASYRQTKKIKDREFDVDKLASYSLLLELSEQDFFVLVVDTQQNKALFLEHLVFDEAFVGEFLLEQLSHLFDEHHFLKAGFWKEIKFIVKNRCFAFVPNSLYAEEKRKFFLKLNAEYTEDEVLYTSGLKGTEARCIFGVKHNLNLWINSLYPSKQVLVDHAANVFCDAVTKLLSKKEGEELFIHADTHCLTIIGLRNGELHYCNVFSYATAEDMVYFIMLVMHELNFNPETAYVHLYGEVDQTSIFFTKLHKYLRYLKLGKRPKHLKFGFEFDDMFDYQYFELFSAYQQV